ncbi:MAG: septum formation initiator family protein [Desulfobacteraceae bacterium]|nr:septum formation initiator family protein [Desulfobacteraceae bacterium]
MNSGKSKFWKIPLIILCLLIGIVAWLGFGEQGLIHLYRTEMERQAHMDKIRRLAEENQDLLKEIDRLRTDMKYVESVARRQLNLIKENEVIYRFETEEGGSSGLSSATVTGIEQADERVKPEREVFRNGKIK